MAKEFGSLNNLLMSGSKSKAPEVGDGATILSWTDRTPATVVEVRGKTIVIQEDSYARKDALGMSEHQEYEYSRNPEGAKYTVRLTPKGWKIVKGARVLVGYRERHYDYSF